MSCARGRGLPGKSRDRTEREMCPSVRCPLRVTDARHVESEHGRGGSARLDELPMMRQEIVDLRPAHGVCPSVLTRRGRPRPCSRPASQRSGLPRPPRRRRRAPWPPVEPPRPAPLRAHRWWRALEHLGLASRAAGRGGAAAEVGEPHRERPASMPGNSSRSGSRKAAARRRRQPGIGILDPPLDGADIRRGNPGEARRNFRLGPLPP